MVSRISREKERNESHENLREQKQFVDTVIKFLDIVGIKRVEEVHAGERGFQAIFKQQKLVYQRMG